jgi:long-chain acyl-CoA synthetase
VTASLPETTMNTHATTSNDNLPSRLLELAASRPGAPALRRSVRGYWREWTWSEYAQRVAHVAAGLRAYAVRPGERVAIHAENRPEWLIADLAIQGIGAQSVGLYPTSPSTEIAYLMKHSESCVVFVEDEEQLDKTLAVLDELPHLRGIVIMDPRGVDVEAHPLVESFEALEVRGASNPEAYASYVAGVSTIDPESVGFLVYTSGTTGPPKGSMISHANVAASGDAFLPGLAFTHRDEILSYLPLCHLAERMMSIIGPLSAGAAVNFGEGGPSFANDMRQVQPTVFLGVPRVWERMMANVEIRMADASWLKRKAFALCMAAGLRMAPRAMSGSMTPLDRVTRVACELLVFRALRERLGLLRVKSAISGAAPIAPQVLEFLWAIGVPVREAYGQTENTAVCTMTPVGDVRLGYVGRAVPGVELKIAEDGEILTRSAGVFQGYLADPEASRQAVDGDGWLHTGDVGILDDDGFLKITDRKKDIIITAGGKNISPSELENNLKTSPFVREAIVIGDTRKYLTALIGIERDTVSDWATRRGLAHTTYSDLASKPEVRSLIEDVVEAANLRVAQVEQVRRFVLLTKELDHEDGELTATQKVKRAAIAERFSEQIEGMYR